MVTRAYEACSTDGFQLGVVEVSMEQKLELYRV